MVDTEVVDFLTGRLFNWSTFVLIDRKSADSSVHKIIIYQSAEFWSMTIEFFW